MRALATWSMVLACGTFGAWTAGAQTRVWTSTNNGVWSTDANWLGGVPPAAGTTIRLPNLQVGTVTATVDAAWSATGAVNGIVFEAGNGNSDWVGNYVLNSSGVSALGLGAGGITVLDDYISSANNYHEIAANLTLTASQAWNVLPYTPSTPSLAGVSVGTVLRLSGAVSGANPGTVFTKSGSWYMEVRGPNGGFGTNISAIVLAGGRFNLVNGQAAGNSFDRIGDNTAIIGKGGTWYRSRSATTNGTERIGQLSISEGLTQISGTAAVDGLQSNLTYRFASFDPNVGPAAAFAYTPFSQVDVVFSDLSGIPTNNGIMGGWAIYNDSAQYLWLVKPNSTSTSFTGLPGTDFSNSTISAAAATQNVNLATDTNYLLTANLAVNSVRYRGPTNGIVNLGGFQMRIGSGGLLHSSPSAGTSTLLFTNGTLTAGTGVDRPGTLYFTGAGASTTVHPIDIPATITDNGTGVVNVVQYNLTGGGSLTLRGTNSYTGFTAIDNGTVSISWDGTNASDNAPLGKVPAAFVADNIRLAGGSLQISANMMLHTNRGIQLGGPGGTINTAGKTFTNNGAISGSGDLLFYNGTTVLGGTQPNTYTGNTIVANNASKLILSKNGAIAVPGNLFIIGVNNAGGGGTLQLNGSEQIADDAVVTLIRPWGSSGTGNGTAIWQLEGYNETIGGLVGTLAAGNTNSNALIVENGNASALSNSTLTISTPAGTYFSYQGALRNGNTGVLSVVKSGAGMQEFAGVTNLYSGGTVVSGGTLLVNNTATSGTGSGAVVVTNGATLGGTGSITGTVTVYNGTLDPGAYPGTVGTLTVGALTFQPSGVLVVDLSDNTLNDKVVVNGALTLGGAVNVHLLGGYNPPNGQAWTIMTASGAIDDSVKMQPPTGFRVKKSGGSVVLTRLAPGSVLLVQ